MTGQIEIDLEQMTKQHAHQRRVDDRGWLVGMGFTLLGGLIGWLLTKKTDWIFVCSFLALYSLFHLMHTHFTF